MNEQQYRQLCKACDRVLMEQVSTIERIAISWLHVIREHPMPTQKMIGNFSNIEQLLERLDLRIIQ